MTFHCNGCGREHDTLGGFLGYGKAAIPPLHDHSDLPQGTITGTALYMKTLCPRCRHVMKDILLSSDLSEQWDNYNWELVGEEYVEGYDDE